MPKSICRTCNNATLDWSWTEAFDKFGFNDGDGQVMTEHVADILRFAGYTVLVEPWGFHNVTIASIKLGGVEQIPFDHITFGYDEIRAATCRMTSLPCSTERCPTKGEAAA